MDIRFRLVELAQAGDADAARSLLEANLAPVYRLALSILDDPGEAARAAREASLAQLEELPAYPGPTGHTAWLYRLTFQVCRPHLWKRRLARRLPGRLRVPLGLPPSPASNQPALDGPLFEAVANLADGLRLPLVLRYAHDLLPQEAAEVLNWRLHIVQARLRQARRRLLPPPAIDAEPPEGIPADGLTHAEAETLLETAADHAITPPDSSRLKRHLEGCARCQDFSRRLADLEDELRAAFQAHWDGQPLPPQDAAGGALEGRRRQAARRRVLSFGGALAFSLLLVGMIVLMPGLLSEKTLPAPLSTAAPPTAVSAHPAAPTRSPTPFNSRNLLAEIYPGKIAFIIDGQTSDHLFTMDPKSERYREITGGGGDHSDPTWSPDGRRIAFLLLPANNIKNQVYVVNADGSGERQVTRPGYPQGVDPLFDWNPSGQVRYPQYGPLHWSPDGHYLASAVWASDSQDFLALLPVDGGEPHILPVHGIVQDFVSWSPDGSSVAYLSDSGWVLWLWQPGQPLKEGENPRPLNLEGAWDIVFGLAWSPDSSRIALLGGLRETDLVQADLHILDRSGNEVKLEPVSLGVLTSTQTRSSQLAWSPDGRYLAMIAVFTDRDEKSGQILLITTGLTGTVPLVAGISAEISDISWSPDGRWLAYSAGLEIWAASLKAYESEQQHLVRLSTAFGGHELNWQNVN